MAGNGTFLLQTSEAFGEGINPFSISLALLLFRQNRYETSSLNGEIKTKHLDWSGYT